VENRRKSPLQIENITYTPPCCPLRNEVDEDE